MEGMEPAAPQPKKDYLLPASILIAALLIAGALVYNVGQRSDGQTASLSGAAGQAPSIDLANVVFLGDPKAKVTLVEYGDYQCPFCGKFFEETEPLIRNEYINTGKVRMVYKDLAFLGPESLAAAEAARCAADQGKFWEYHDALFIEEGNEDRNDDGTFNGSSENTGNLNKDLFLRLARNFGLDTSEFTACLDSRKHRAAVEADLAEARAVIPQPSTPTIFINGKMLQGALPYPTFKQAIEQALSDL